MNQRVPRGALSLPTTSPPYRDEDGGEVRPPIFNPISCTSPNAVGEVRRGWRGRPESTTSATPVADFNRQET